MSVVINTNSAATAAASALNGSNAMLQKSLSRLSSGSKIVSPADDAGGLAVSMRMTAQIRSGDAQASNNSNAVSFLQTQDGALKTAGNILSRMSELKTLSTDVTKTAGDLANYDKEFAVLYTQLTSLGSASFNGVAVFGGVAATLAVGTNTITQSDYATAGTGAITTIGATLALTTSANIDSAITSVASCRAQNGAEQSVLGFSTDMLETNKTNLEAANSRIIDVDVASESTQLAKNNILVQAGASMLSQANSSAQIALKLLQQ